MIFPTFFERALIKKARRDCREDRVWRWRARVNRICRWGERLLILLFASIAVSTIVISLPFLALWLLSGYRIASADPWNHAANGQLLPLALFSVASLGIASRLGYGWRSGIAKFKPFSIRATLPFPDRRLFAAQRNLAIGWSTTFMLPFAAAMGLLAFQAKVPPIGWIVAVALLAAQYGVLYFTMLSISLLLEHPRRNTLITAGLFIIAVNSLVLTVVGPYFADHADGLAGFAFIFLPTGWIFGAFYYLVLHADWRGVLFLPAVALFIWYSRQFIRARLRIHGFTFDQPGSIAPTWFALEELESDRRSSDALAARYAFRTRDLPSEMAWQSDELRIAMFPFEYYETEGRFDRWLGRRATILLESACAGLRTEKILIMIAGGIFLLFDWLVPAFARAPSLVRSGMLAAMTIPHSFSRSTSDEKAHDWLLNLQAATRLPFTWRDLMLALWHVNVVVVAPVVGLAICLALFHCYRHGVPSHVVFPGYLGILYVIAAAPWLWIVPPIIKARPWQIPLIVPFVCFYLWAGLYPLSIVAEALHPSLFQTTLAIFATPVSSYLIARAIRYLYTRGWIDFA